MTAEGFPIGEPVQRRPEQLASEDVPLVDNQLVDRLRGIGQTDEYVASASALITGWTSCPVDIGKIPVCVARIINM